MCSSHSFPRVSLSLSHSVRERDKLPGVRVHRDFPSPRAAPVVASTTTSTRFYDQPTSITFELNFAKHEKLINPRTWLEAEINFDEKLSD